MQLELFSLPFCTRSVLFVNMFGAVPNTEFVNLLFMQKLQEMCFKNYETVLHPIYMLQITNLFFLLRGNS